MHKNLDWQNRCLTTFKNKYDSSDNFVIVAGTGSGKTHAGAICGRYSLVQEKNKNPFLLVVCPFRAIKNGWRNAFRIHGIKCTSNNNYIYDPELDAGIITYASAGLIVPILLKMDRPLIIIFDEFHHMESCAAWASPFIDLYQNEKDKPIKTIALSGTPWREKGELPECVIEYDENNCVKSDFKYTYGENLAENDDERNTVLVRFEAIEGEVTQDIYDKDTDEIIDSITVHTKDLNHSDSLQPFVEFNDVNLNTKEVVTKAIDMAVKTLNNERKSYHYFGGLIITKGRTEAKAIKKYLQSEHGKKAILVTSDDPKAHKLIEEFSRDVSKEWIIAINMISEGVDIPRLKIELDLTDKKTFLHIIQRWGRVLRRIRDENGFFLPSNVAYVFYIRHPKLDEMARKIEEEIEIAKREKGEGEAPPEATTYKKSKESIFDTSNIMASGKTVEEKIDNLASWMWEINYNNVRDNRRGYTDVIFIAETLIASNSYPPGYEEKKEVKKEKPKMDADALRQKMIDYFKNIALIAYAIGQNGEPDYSSVNIKLNRMMGIRKFSSKNANLENLRRRVLAYEELHREYGVQYEEFPREYWDEWDAWN